MNFLMKDMFSVEEKVVLVVGAGGIGSVYCRAFAENGAKVIATNTGLEKATAVQEELKKDGLTIDVRRLDITDDEEVQAVIGEIAKTYGRIDVLVHTAGIALNSEAENYTADEVRRVMDVNINGMVFVTREVGKVMMKQGGGKMILVGSIAGTQCHEDLSMPYECSKAAVHQLTKSLAGDWGKYGIKVNCIAPTWVYTAMTATLKTTYAKLIAAHPLGRIAEVEDLVGAALFLASPGSDFITGQVLLVDGGWTCRKPIEIPEDERL